MLCHGVPLVPRLLVCLLSSFQSLLYSPYVIIPRLPSDALQEGETGMSASWKCKFSFFLMEKQKQTRKPNPNKTKKPRLPLPALDCHVMNGNKDCALVSAVFGVYSCFIIHPFYCWVLTSMLYVDMQQLDQSPVEHLSSFWFGLLRIEQRRVILIKWSP